MPDTSVSKNLLVREDEFATWDLFASNAAQSLLRRQTGASMQDVAAMAGDLADALLTQRRQRLDPKVQALIQERQVLHEVAMEKGLPAAPTFEERRRTL